MKVKVEIPKATKPVAYMALLMTSKSGRLLLTILIVRTSAIFSHSNKTQTKDKLSL